MNFVWFEKCWLAHLSHCRSCSLMRDTKFLVQSSPFKPWLIPCGIFPTYWTEMMLLSEGQVGISREKVIKLDVQRRECLYLQSFQLSLKVNAGEWRWGLGSFLPCCWGGKGQTGTGPGKGHCPRNVSHCRVSMPCKPHPSANSAAGTQVSACHGGNHGGGRNLQVFPHTE